MEPDVVVPCTHLTTASSSCVLLCHTRSLISSVLKVSTQRFGHGGVIRFSDSADRREHLGILELLLVLFTGIFGTLVGVENQLEISAMRAGRERDPQRVQDGAWCACWTPIPAAIVWTE